MRALRERPTALERWPKGVREGIKLATRTGEQGRRVLPEAGAEGRAGVRRDGERSPSPPAGPRTRSARPRSPPWPGRPRWARSPSTPGRCRRADVDHPDELRIDLDPQPGTDFADAARVALAARELLERARAGRLPEDQRQPGRAHLRADRAALGLRRRAPRRDRLRPRAGAPYRRGHHGVVEGGARRADLRRLQPELPRPHDRVRLLACGRSRARRCRRRSTWDELPTGRPARPQPAHRAGAARRARRPARRRSTTRPASLEPLLELYADDAPAAWATCPTRRTTRRCRASRRGCSPAGRTPPNWEE